MAADALKIPITNIYGDGVFTAQIKVGGNGAPVNVILDTGSSTLAVDSASYNPGSDAGMKTTTFAQHFSYKSGGWIGPVVQAGVAMGSGAQSVSIDTHLAVTAGNESGTFGSADGILGLAFNQLNFAYDLSSYLADQKINPLATYPWPFPLDTSSITSRQFTDFLSRLPIEDLTPYFTDLASAEITGNIFAFYTHRSAVSNGTKDPAADPLNNGYFILGGGPEQTDLYSGEFIDVTVVDDLYYNTNLLAVQVDRGEQIGAAKLPKQYAKTYKSNSIIDSGTNVLLLASDVYAAIFSSLGKINPGFTSTIQEAQNNAIAVAELNIGDWPDIKFILTGPGGGQATVTCTPSSYWQVDAPQAGRATFKIINSNGSQSILGLPLLNNYYTVFDRTQHPYGTIRFAAIIPPQ
jgi:hypothetical protein